MRLAPLLLTGVVTLAAAAPALAQEDTRPEFVIAGIGDSYSSGEGAPQVRGQHDDQGQLTGTAETWGPTDDAQRCHRSPNSWQARAAERLRQEFQAQVRVTFVHVACSGATIDGGEGFGRFDGGALTPYTGPEPGNATTPLPPQVTQLNDDFLAQRQGRDKRIDALLMSLGGNDAGFSPVVAACLGDNFANLVRNGSLALALATSGYGIGVSALIQGAGAVAADNLQHCHWSSTPGDPVNFNPLPGLLVSSGVADLDDRYGRLAAALNGDGSPALAVRPEQVYIAEYPNPARDETGVFCNGTQTSDPVYRRGLLGEAKFLERDVVGAIDEAVANAAETHDWNLVETRPAYRLHGVCADAASFFRANGDALRFQGNDVTGFAVGLFFSHPVAAGVGHPNEGGYQAIADSTYERLRTQLREQFLEGRPTLGVDEVRENPPLVRLSWTQPPVEGLERYRLEIATHGSTGQVVSRRVEEIDETQQTFSHQQRGTFTYRLQACTATTCKAFSEPVKVSNVRPGVPRDLARVRPSGLLAGRALAVRWSREANAARYEVQYRKLVERGAFAGVLRPGNALPEPVVQRAILGGFFERAVTTEQIVLGSVASPLGAGDSYEIRVRACSQVGCSAFSPTEVFPVSQPSDAVGEVTLTGDEQRLLPPGKIGDVGVRVLPGSGRRPVRFVDVRLVDRDGPTGCVRADQRDRTLALSSGDCRGFSSRLLNPGQRTSLRRGGLTLDARRSRIKTVGRGDRGIDARVAFRPESALRGEVLTVQVAARDVRGLRQGFTTVGTIVIPGPAPRQRSVR